MPDKPVIFDIETLNAIGARLYDHAESITNVARQDMADDLRLAARALDRFAHLRFEIGEIAAKTKDPDTARKLRDALSEAEGEQR